MKKPTEEELRAKIKRAPLWIQDIANAALREAEAARKELAEYLDGLKVSPFYTVEYVGPKMERKRRYFDAQEITVEHAGIELEITTRPNNMRDGNGIEIRYSRAGDMGGGVAFIPKHNNCFELRLPEKMR